MADDEISSPARPADDAPVIFDPDGVPAVYAATPKEGWWSGNNQVGIELPFAPGANNRQTILKFDMRGPPRVWTLTLGLLRGEVNVLQSFDVTAVIGFGVGGVTQEVRIDWKEGATITMPFNALNVIAEYGIEFDSPTDLFLRASIGVGSAVSAFPTKTDAVLVNTDTAAVAAPLPTIPNFARDVQIVASNSTATNLFFTGGVGVAELEFYKDQTGLNRVSGIAGDLVLNYARGIPIPNGARYYHLVGPFGGAGTLFNVVWSIAL